MTTEKRGHCGNGGSLKRRLDPAKALAEIGRVLALGLAPNAVANRIVESVRDLIASPSAAVRRHQPATRDLVALAISSDADLPFPWTDVWPEADGASGVALRDRRVVTTPDLLADRRLSLSPRIAAMAARSGSMAVLAVPLIVGDAPIGVLTLADHAGRVFDEEEIGLARAFADLAAMALDNARLQTARARCRREAGELAKVARMLTEILDVAGVTELIVKTVRRFFAGCGAILAIVGSDGSLVTVASSGIARKYFRRGLVFPPKQSFSGRVAAEGHPLWCRDVQGEDPATCGDELWRLNAAAGFHALLSVPLRVKDRTTGVLTIVDSRVRDFSPTEVALLQTFADQAALPLENSGLYGGTNRKRRDINDALRKEISLVELLQSVAIAVNEASIVEDALQICVERVCRHAGWPLGHVWTVEANHTLVPTRIWHFDEPDRFQIFRAIAETRRLASGEGLPGRVLATRAPVWMSDVTSEAGFSRPAEAKADDIRAGLAFPVLVGAEVVAVLEFFSSEIVEPEAQLLDVLANIGTQLGRVIERKRAGDVFREATAALQRSEEQYRTLATSLPDVTWWADRSGRVTFISPNVAHILGFTAEEECAAGPELWFGRIHPDDREQVQVKYDRLFSGRGAFDVEFRFQRKDGQWIWLQDRAVATAERDGVLCAYGVFSDITERRRAAEIRERLLKQVMTIQEEERARLARELHDSTAQSLVSLLLGLDGLARSRSLPASRKRARELYQQAASALEEVRRMASGLRPSLLDDLGLLPALEHHADEYRRSRRIAVTVRGAGTGAARLPPLIETALYRIAQEALSNAARHAAPTMVIMALERLPSSIRMTVTDDGSGFDPTAMLAASAASDHFGLHGMRERAALVNGSVGIASAPERGTTVTVDIPLAES